MSAVGSQINRVWDSLGNTVGEIALSLETRRLTQAQALSWARSLRRSAEEAERLVSLLKGDKPS